MKELDDEEIQRIVEEQMKNKLLSEELPVDSDFKLYSVLFTELAEMNNSARNPEVAEMVIAKIHHKQNRREQINYNLVIFIIFIVMLTITLGAVRLTSDVRFHMISQFFFDHKDTFLFVLFTYITIQVLDKYIVKKHKAPSAIKM